MKQKQYTKDEIRYITHLPPLLNEIPDRPKGIYVCGDESLLTRSDLTYICIIGSRRHTTYGFDVCKELIYSLKGMPIAIISGLALGIDTIVHKTALEVGIPCIAVPGSGLDPDIIYPKTNYSLASEIIEKGGLLLSEYEPAFRASPWSFPMRNRIMAGLSHAVLVIEGEEDSGTLITARLALEYNRDVLAVPGSIFQDTSKGPLSLIRRGAFPICSKEDLYDALNFPLILELKDDLYHNEKYEQCSDEELSVLHLLKDPVSKDELLKQSKLNKSKLDVVLSILEIRGLIIEEMGYIKTTRP
jgi:DNA processing protein